MITYHERPTACPACGSDAIETLKGGVGESDFIECDHCDGVTEVDIR